MTTASDLADKLETLDKDTAFGAWDDMTDLFSTNLPLILSSLRRVEKLEGALRCVHADSVAACFAARSPGFDATKRFTEIDKIARQALTGEA